jgi:hypothetical protein
VKSIPEVRVAVEETVKQLGDVRIIAASELPGVTFGFFKQHSLIYSLQKITCQISLIQLKKIHLM